MGHCISGFTDEDFNYIKRLNYFDNELSKFIAELKACGLYDKSLIVIASDHQVRRGAASKAIVGPYIPWIILNSPVTGNVRSVVRQVDLFPTILEILGKDYRFMGMPYSGVGRSIYKQYAAGFYGLSTAGNVVMLILISVIAFPLQHFLNKREEAMQ